MMSGRQGAIQRPQAGNIDEDVPAGRTGPHPVRPCHLVGRRLEPRRAKMIEHEDLRGMGPGERGELLQLPRHDQHVQDEALPGQLRQAGTEFLRYYDVRPIDETPLWPLVPAQRHPDAANAWRTAEGGKSAPYPAGAGRGCGPLPRAAGPLRRSCPPTRFRRPPTLPR